MLTNEIEINKFKKGPEQKKKVTHINLLNW